MGLLERAPAQGGLICRVNELPLVPGEYLLTLGCLTNDRQLDLLERVASLSVQPRDYFGTGQLPPRANGSFLVNASWQLTSAEIDQLASA
jgi:lipopolysaccharide transport system ATP-binding protein